MKPLPAVLLVLVAVAVVVAVGVYLAQRQGPGPGVGAATRPAAKIVGADWPMFRGGASLAGVAEGRVGDKFVLWWSFKTGDAVKSSPAIVGGRVFRAALK